MRGRDLREEEAKARVSWRMVQASLGPRRASLLTRGTLEELYEAVTGSRLDLSIRRDPRQQELIERRLEEAFQSGALVLLRTADPLPPAGSPQQQGPVNTALRTFAGSTNWDVENEKLISTLARDQFRELAIAMNSAEFLMWLKMLFGSDIPESAYVRLRAELLKGSLPEPGIRIVEGGLHGHDAAYDRKERVIRVTRGLVLSARGDNNEAWKLLVALIEEYGHHVDNLLRTHYSSVGGDAPLDEGARMAYALVNLGWTRKQVRCEFARYVTPRGEVPLEVEYAGLTQAVERFLPRHELDFDAREGALEFFGAGRGAGHAGSYGHESIEDALEKADFDAQARKRVYFGNWLRDYSQAIDPKTIRKEETWPPPFLPTKKGLTSILDVLARLKFGDASTFRVTTDKLGVYRSEEHIDNPSGMTGGQHIDKKFNGPPSAEALTVDPSTRMKRFIRTSSPKKGQPARKHRVKDGETLDGIARANGLTWQELALHNFGTTVPAEINHQLRTKVGCTKRTADGRNYIFTSQDQPGLLELPGTTGGVGTEASYTALHYMTEQLKLAIKEGPKAEGYRLLGSALHTLEDFFSHTNFVEVALICLGKWVEPWVPAPRGRSTPAKELPITTGKFGSLDTAASILLVIGENLQKEDTCIPGEPTAASLIILILLKDFGYHDTHALMKSMQSTIHELEKEYPRLATLMCKTIGKVVDLFMSGIGLAVRASANTIDDAQTMFVEDPSSTDPTHSQLAKDHDDHPLHALAAKLAAGAVLDVGKAVQQAWRKQRTAEEVVATAAQYFVHPSQIVAGGSTAWILETIRAWIPSHGEAIKRLGSRSWIADWTKERSKELQELVERANRLMGID
ncbi:MAG: LysM peptidoglycan-binding domain-containing protein [Myxococcaceae bacterium]|nr:LysM peptidoglycan-binding domain-containing protein [Myxococcaceae bacterium]